MPVQLLFGQMLGVLGTGWAIWRWRNMPFSIGRYEGILRIFFAASMLWSFSLTLHPILLLFALVDLVGGGLHLAKPIAAEEIGTTQPAQQGTASHPLIWLADLLKKRTHIICNMTRINGGRLTNQSSCSISEFTRSTYRKVK
ncbi:hypothetical protein [Pseudovibrio sp. Tun.PSC04-5.I4]|uniref:hypothetical protein n=1 Tax=Pseudovibrio sp. Tun.PSC04-5.I4 TaxID=1798213 RepID=UPI001AD9182E|nr:hypothetical protein [Pseudovibrio sp. Tun.PSC04-5.I4]